MTDLQAAPMPGTVPLSTTIDVGTSSAAVGGGAPPPEKAPEAKPETPGDTMRAELARIKAEESKDADKVKVEAKDAAKDAKAKADEALNTDADKKAGKDAEPDKSKPDAQAKADEPADKAEERAAEKPATEREADKGRQSEGAKRTEPPARFLPKAKEAWVNVPHSVREDVYRMSEDHDAEVSRYKVATERYEAIRPFDELAKTNGRDLRESLVKINQIENVLAKNPITGLEMILREIGPRKADGSAISLYDIAQHIARQSPEQFQQTQRQAHEQQQTQQREQQQNGEVQQLRTELKTIQAERLAEKIIEPFKADPKHSRYQELSQDIAFFLKSGKIPASLSPVERLSAAYDMAERINPVGSRSASQALENTDAPVAAKPAAPDPDGSKSVRGAPTGGSDPDDDDADSTDLRKLLQREARKLAS